MSIVIMILLLSFLVLVHEAGHFFAARALKIKVSKFGFGLPIGPTLWSKKIGDVEVLIHAFLLGGYVSFPDDEKDCDIPVDSQERFINRPVWQRMIVISAGVIANIITAFVFVLLTAFVWGKLPSGQYEVYINKIAAAKGQSVWDSGIQSGDRVLKINGSDIKSSYALTIYSKNSKQNDGKVDKDLVAKNLDSLKKLNPKIEENDLIKENTIVLLPEKQDEAGKFTLNDIAYALSDGKRPVNITVLREGKLVELKPIYPNKDGLIGVMIEAKEVLMPTKTIPQAINGTFKYLWEQTYMLVYGLWQLFTGKIPIKDLHGIVVITKVGGDVIQNSGFFSGLLLTAMISLDLALVNFLPIPALDGGHFMFLLIEKLRGKPVDEEAINKVSSVFFILLIIFMIFVVFNDIYALVLHKL